MTVLGIAWAYLKDRPALNLLNALLLALGVATIAILLHLSDSIENRLARDAAGIDLVVGAKGSPLQLILSSIFHADVPTGNITLSEAKLVSGSPLVRLAIPLALGDSFRGFRIVGTTPAYPDLYGGVVAQGRLWRMPFEAVLGADVVRKVGIPLGDKFIGTHGLGTGGHAHEESAYTVVGILKPTGTVLDRLILTPVDSVIFAHKTHEVEEHLHEHGEHDDAHDDAEAKLETADRDLSQEITALLVRYRTPLAAIRLPSQVNQTTAMQAAVPAVETTRLLSIVGVGLDAVRAFALIMLGSAALGIFVSLYTAMAQRAGDVAILRTMGASRLRVLGQVVIEGMLLALAGGVLGLLMAHGGLAIAAQMLPEAATLGLSGTSWLPQEAALLLAVVACGALAALTPALLAYRVDIVKTLARLS